MAINNLLTYTSIVAAGGATGAVLRFYVSALWIGAPVPGQFPWATFFANVLGSLLFGVLFSVFQLQLTHHESLRLFVMVGMLGAFTTYSAFAFEVVSLFEHSFTSALVYFTSTTLAAVMAMAVGIWFGRILMTG